MQPHKFSYSEQERIYRRLNALVSSGAATFYKDACRLMEMDNPLESTTHLVGHLLREIESSLRSVLAPIAKPTIEESNLIKCPECKHKFHQPDEKPTHKDQIKAILKALEISEEGEIAKIWLALTGRKNDYALHSLAHRRDLAPPRTFDEEFRNFWKQIQLVLATVLDKFETRASAIWGELDKILLKTEPSNEDIKYLRLETPNSAFALGYFFERLESPAWLKPLQKAGFFANPPGMEIDNDSKSFSFPLWRQSQYLIKVSSHDPATVLDISQQLLELGSDNIGIYEDLAKAALKMPANDAARWVKQAIGWLKQQTNLYYSLPDTLGKLIAYLTLENQTDTAIELARVLLAVLPNEDSDSSSFSKPFIRFNEYYYHRIIKEHLSVLTEHQPNEVLILFCELLDRYLSLSYSTSEWRKYYDYSYSWCLTLNSNSWNLHGIKSLLAVSIWNIANHILERDQSQIRNLLQKLQSYRWQIFERIALLLMRRFPEKVSDIIVERLTKRDRFQYLGSHFDESHEHARLLQEQFKNLSIEAQNQIFQWLAEGPVDALKVDQEKRDGYIKHWQRDWLSIISDYLPPELKQLYEQLVQEIGAPISLDSVAVGNAGRSGSNSPKSGAELAQIAQDDMDELFTYLREWQPSKKLREKTRNGLAEELAQQVIIPNPQNFVSQIDRFKELDPEFMIWLLRGLKKALENSPSEQPPFLWQPVINFCTWMQENLHEIRNNSTSNGYYEWSRICDAIVELIQAGLLPKESNKIPLTLRNQVWQLLESLTNDPQLTPGFTTHYQGSNMGAYGDSINTVRGKAMYTVVWYASWIRQDANGNTTSQDFNDLPEVQQILEQHLDPRQDPSSAIRAVYGQMFPCLFNLASEWTLHNIDQIFPESPEFQWMFEAAWEGYIYNNVHADIFSVLRKKYNHAVEQLSVTNTTSGEQAEVVRGLTFHLLDLFWWKIIELGESDSLLEKFFANAYAYPREEFMDEIGWRLLNDDFEVNEELRQRLQKLLEWRLTQAKKFSIVEQASDLKYFSSWFASGKLDNQWAIAKLVDVFNLLGTVHNSRNFFEHLETLASTMPQDAIQLLCLMADSNQAGQWFLSHYRDRHRGILRAILQSEDEVAQKLARDLINRLLIPNLGDYRELIS
ncbi:MAG: hypothetical protein RMY30_038270 [Nostoc sp. CmiSLP01]|nr:hypothetical protein [Nostoc sp. CmiSLP01]MDZ8286017.1 hypothetical protein [Nostoc sp. ChiSLP01]